MPDLDTPKEQADEVEDTRDKRTPRSPSEYLEAETLETKRMATARRSLEGRDGLEHGTILARPWVEQDRHGGYEMRESLFIRRSGMILLSLNTITYRK